MSDQHSFSTVEEARAYAEEQGGKYLVNAPEILSEIEAAEAAGGFEGGMSGAAGEGGYSTSGVVPDHSEADESAGTVDLDGAVIVGAFFEWGAETLLNLRDAIEAWRGDYGPILLVPKKELDRWLNGGVDTDNGA